MINLYNKKFEELLSEFEDGLFKLICIDPPYDINYTNKDFIDIFDFDKSASESYRILNQSGNCIVFAGWSKVKDIIDVYSSYGFILNNWIIWDRQKTKNGGKKNFTSAREDILWFIKNTNYTFNKQLSFIKKKTKGFGSKNGTEFRQLSNVWCDISPIMFTSKEYNGYSCQKPVSLYERIVKVFSNENDLCIDFCCGSGGFGEACKNLNRNFILNDENPEAMKLVEERLK